MNAITVVKEYPKDSEWIDIFNSLNVLRRIKSANSIAIKVNFAAGTVADKDSHIITDIKKISGIIRAIATANSHCMFLIAEADSTNDGFAYLKFEHLGLPESLELEDGISNRVSVLDMSRDRLCFINKKEFRYFDSDEKKLWLSEQYANADFVISLSNLKTHSVTGYTGACKNLFGCLPAFDKSVYHVHIHKIIHDLVLAKTPNLSIVDGFYGMEKNGPVSGKKIDLGFMIVADNPYIADIVASAEVGINPYSIKYLQYLSLVYGRVEYNLELPVKKIQKPELFLRAFNSIGIGIQRFGGATARFGHRIHVANNPIILVKVILRPIIVKMIGADNFNRYRERQKK